MYFYSQCIKVFKKQNGLQKATDLRKLMIKTELFWVNLNRIIIEQI